MPTYVYETIDEPCQRFEIEQRMSDPTLTQHPETGAAVRRVVIGGAGFTGFAQAACGSDCGLPGSGASLPCCGGGCGFAV